MSQVILPPVITGPLTDVEARAAIAYVQANQVDGNYKGQPYLELISRIAAQVNREPSQDVQDILRTGGFGRYFKPPVPTKLQTTTETGPVFGLIKEFTDLAQRNPGALKELVLESVLAVSVASAVLSVIPLEANFGGPLAARLIGDIVHPWRRAAYDDQIDVALRPVYPTQDVSPRMLVTAIEGGAITDDDLHGELVRSGTRPEAAGIIARLALLKRFEAETKDDVALLRTYQSDINKATIQALQDELRSRLADLKAQRRDVHTRYLNTVAKVA
jgi:hypothetical protein